MTRLVPPTVKQMEVGSVPLLDADDEELPASPTLDELLAHCQEFDIPTTAKVTYLACGTHTVALEWTPA